MGTSFFKQGDMDNAIVSFKKTLDYDSNFDKALHYLGKCILP